MIKNIPKNVINCACFRQSHYEKHELAFVALASRRCLLKNCFFVSNVKSFAAKRRARRRRIDASSCSLLKRFDEIEWDDFSE